MEIQSFESRDLIRSITTNLIITSLKNIRNKNSLTQDTVKKKTKENLNKIVSEPEKLDKKKQYLNSLIINFTNEFREGYYELRKLLDEHYISSPMVQRSDAKCSGIVKL